MKKTIFAFLLITVGTAFAQQFPNSQKELEETILKLDAEAFNAYNKCDLDKFKTFFTDDLEFYHDKNGHIETSTKLIETMKTGMCSNPNWKLRREALKETLKVYPLMPYGAIITGDHQFYITENGKENLDGIAKFVHVWILTKNGWKMSRVLSFDHRAAN